MIFSRKSLAQFINGFCWALFLLLLGLLSFSNTVFPDHVWWYFHACIYALLALSFLSGVLGGKINVGAIFDAKALFFLLGLSLLWILLSLLLPIENAAYELLQKMPYGQTGIPEWYQSERLGSFVPQKTLIFLLSELALIAFLLLAVLLLQSRRRLCQLLILITIVACVHAIVGIIAKYADVLLIDKAQLDGHYSAARAWFVNRNHYASFLSLCLLGLLSFLFKPFFIEGKRKLVRLARLEKMKMIVQLFLIVIILLAIMLSESRAGVAALFLGLVITAYFAGRYLNNARQFTITMLILTVFVVVALNVFADTLLARFSLNGDFLGERVLQWQMTWDIIQKQLIFGYGANSYADVFQLFRSDEALRQVTYNQAHNDYLHIWFEQGLIGLSIYLVFLTAVYRRLINVLKKTRDPFLSALAFSCLLVISAALLQSLVGFNLQILNIRFYFFVIIAIVLVLPSINKNVSKSGTRN